MVSLFAEGAGGEAGEGEAETRTTAAMAELARAERRSIVPVFLNLLRLVMVGGRKVVRY